MHSITYRYMGGGGCCSEGLRKDCMGVKDEGGNLYSSAPIKGQTCSSIQAYSHTACTPRILLHDSAVLFRKLTFPKCKVEYLLLFFC